MNKVINAKIYIIIKIWIFFFMYLLGDTEGSATEDERRMVEMTALGLYILGFCKNRNQKKGIILFATNLSA